LVSVAARHAAGRLSGNARGLAAGLRAWARSQGRRQYERIGIRAFPKAGIAMRLAGPDAVPRRIRQFPASAVQRPISLGAIVLVSLYVWRYFAAPALPGNMTAFPIGWWGWFDQGNYIQSARALARFDFAAAQHWYPLGYSLMGAPFTKWSPAHPFVLIDLACLLACYMAFVAFARRIGVGSGWAVPIFVVSTAWNRLIFAGWVIPWNTTPTSALIWLLLAAIAAHMQGVRRPLLIGLMAGTIPLIRPAEAPLAGICVLAVLTSDLLRVPRPPPWRLVLLALGGLIPILPYALLHYRIYGAAPTPYMIEEVGFTFHDLGWKAYTLLVDPRAWFLDGEGLLRAAPYMALVPAALIVAFAHGRATALLAVLVAVHAVLYLSYINLLPTGLWRYYNVHYWKWALPAGGLLAFLLLRDLWRWRRAPGFPLAPVALAASVVPLCLRIVPAQVSDGTPAKMLVYAGPEPRFDAAYFGPLVLRDSAGAMRNVRDLRAIPVPGGMRVFALRRPFAADPAWETPPDGWHGDAPPVRYATRTAFGLPCWVPGFHCSKATNGLLPIVPTE
jgi:hypothetical protein